MSSLYRKILELSLGRTGRSELVFKTMILTVNLSTNSNNYEPLYRILKSSIKLNKGSESNRNFVHKGRFRLVIYG